MSESDEAVAGGREERPSPELPLEGGRGTARRPAAREPYHPKPATPLPAEPAKRGMSELARRLLTAAVLIPLVLYIVVLGGLAYLATVMLFVAIGQREFYRLIEDKGALPLDVLGVAFGAALCVVAYVGNEYHATILLTASLLGLMVAQLRKAQIQESLASISGTFFGVFYVAWLLAHAIVLRNFFDVANAKYGFDELLLLGLHPDSGIFFMMFVLSVVVGCDAGAYFAGRAYGRRKLAPKISPGKTVEGALGGVIAGCVIGTAAKALFDWQWPALSAAFEWRLVLPFAFALSVAGIVGDLLESMLKRDAARKDAGGLLPGMGGVLDRIDSPLLAIPIMYYMLLGYLYLTLRVGL
ncbi:MAG: phosphatidate cytidylyltransferase [Myxococcota bacterium]